MNTKAGPFHKYCLSCNECKTNLDASTFHRYPMPIPTLYSYMLYRVTIKLVP